MIISKSRIVSPTSSKEKEKHKVDKVLLVCIVKFTRGHCIETSGMITTSLKILCFPQLVSISTQCPPLPPSQLPKMRDGKREKTTSMHIYSQTRRRGEKTEKKRGLSAEVQRDCGTNNGTVTGKSRICDNNQSKISHENTHVCLVRRSIYSDMLTKA